MELLNKIKKRIQFYIYHSKLCFDIKFNNKSNVAYVFGAPLQRNMGDQAQSYCIDKWIKSNYREYQVKIIVIPHTTDGVIRLIRENIKYRDLIFFHSGYHITDIYNVKEIYEKCIKTFYDFPIVNFPQTVNFENTENLASTAKIYSAHSNMTLLCRDEKSYTLAKSYFKVKKLLLFPDIVTSLIGTYKFDNKREGILFCIRNDIEASYSKKDLYLLMERFTCRKEVTDTTISTSPYEIVKHRIEIIEKILNYYSTFKVIVTDRYHGTIFSLVSNTPVVVISSTDHKLSSGVKWFPKDVFGDYIDFAENLDEAYKKADALLNRNDLKYDLPPYFKEHYYLRLKSIING